MGGMGGMGGMGDDMDFFGDDDEDVLPFALNDSISADDQSSILRGMGRASVGSVGAHDAGADGANVGAGGAGAGGQDDMMASVLPGASLFVQQCKEAPPLDFLQVPQQAKRDRARQQMVCLLLLFPLLHLSYPALPACSFSGQFRLGRWQLPPAVQ
jgi:hypothetical protein